MRLERKPLGSVAQRHTQHRDVMCEHRGGRLANGASRTVTDDSGALSITVWTCAMCGALVEEVHLLARDGKASMHPFRYAVGPRTAREQVHAVSIPGQTKEPMIS